MRVRIEDTNAGDKRQRMDVYTTKVVSLTKSKFCNQRKKKQVEYNLDIMSVAKKRKRYFR